MKTYNVGEKIEGILKGNKKPIKAEFVKWQPIEDRAGNFFLVLNFKGELRYIIDGFIGFINGQPFTPIELSRVSN